MTAQRGDSARDPREPEACPRCGEVCKHDGWSHVHGSGIGIGSCAQRGDFESPAPVSATRERLADALAAIYAGQHRYDVRASYEPFGVDHPQWLRYADALLPVVESLADERAAEALEQAADALDDRAVELWRAYKSAPPTDPRRADPHTAGESDGWENAGTAVRTRAASLRASSRGETQ